MGKHFIGTKAFYKFMESWTEFAVGLRNLIKLIFCCLGLVEGIEMLGNDS